MRPQANSTFSQFIYLVHTDFGHRLLIGFGLLAIIIVFKFIFGMSVPDLAFWFALWIISTYFLFLVIFRKFFERKPVYIVYTYFCGLLLDLILLTGIVYYLGGITWVAPVFYIFYIISAPWIFPIKLATTQIVFTNLIFIFLVLAQILNVIPPRDLFSIQDKKLINFNYFLATLIVAEIVFFFVTFFAYHFQNLVGQKIRELTQANQKLSATRAFLKKEIFNQTKLLRKERDRLAEVVAKSTAELEEKNIILQKRISELEQFYREAVERELKIAKLKEELSKLSH